MEYRFQAGLHVQVATGTDDIPENAQKAEHRQE